MSGGYVYILASAPNGVLYVGVTNDLVRRIYEHRNRLVAVQNVDGRDKPGHDGKQARARKKKLQSALDFNSIQSTRSSRRCRSCEIAIQHAAIDPGQLFQIGNWRALVDLVHGLANQTELDHRTIAGDKPRIGGAARGAQFRPPAGDLLDRRDREVGEGAGFCHKHVGIGGLPHDPRADPVAGGLRQTPLDQCPQRILRVVIVEADVEFRARLPRDHIAGGVADIDRGEFEVRRLELRAAMIERLVAERHDQRRYIRYRVRCALRIGDVALGAIDVKRARQRTAAANLDAIAERFDIAGLAQHAVVEFLAARRDPLQQLDGAVDGEVFLVAGDQKRDRTFAVFSGLAAMGGEIVEHGRDAAGDAALHVDGAAAVEKAILDFARERAMAPGALVARRHHVGMPGEGDVRRIVADAGIEVVDIGGAGFAEGNAVHLETGILQDTFEHTKRAGINRSYRGTAEQIAGNGESISHASA